MRVATQLTVLAVGLLLIAPLAGVADEAGTSSDGACSSLGHLIISEPAVGVHGPFPTLLRRAAVGDAILLQVEYPIAPPFPKSVQVDHGRQFRCIGVFQTDGKIAVLTSKPQQQGIGVGFISVVVQAMNAGQGTVTAKVTLHDGTTKDVPFAFDIENPSAAK
jgi:hypothetical protein